MLPHDDLDLFPPPVDDSDVDDLKALLGEQPNSPATRVSRCRCGFEAQSVWTVVRHAKKCKLKRRSELERRLQQEIGLDSKVCLLLRHHLHVPNSVCDAVGERYLLGGAEALSCLKPQDSVVNCAAELESLVQQGVATLWCPARDADDFEIVPMFAEACASFVRDHPNGRILFHCAAGQSRSVSKKKRFFVPVCPKMFGQRSCVRP